MAPEFFEKFEPHEIREIFTTEIKPDFASPEIVEMFDRDFVQWYKS
jgi:hypothetical protein